MSDSLVAEARAWLLLGDLRGAPHMVRQLCDALVKELAWRGELLKVHKVLSDDCNALDARLKLAEAVCEAAVADLKCSRDAHNGVFKTTDAEWLSGATDSERALLDALTAWRAGASK